MLDLTKLNDYSICKIIFYEFEKYSEFDDLIDDLDLFNLVFANNGLFQVLKNRLFITVAKTSVLYKNTKLNTLHDDYIYQIFPKAPKECFDKILDLFKYVCNKTKYELMVNLYFDIDKEQFIIDIVDQEISGASIRYKYNDKYEFSDKYIRYLQIHSHNTMSAHFSPTDNQDEKNKIPCYYGVIGNLNKPIFSYQFRVWTGLNFKDVEISDIFEGFEENNKINISSDEKKILEDIILKSEKIKKDKSKNNNLFKTIQNDFDDNQFLEDFCGQI